MHVHLITAAIDADRFSAAIRGFVGPLFLLAISVIALSYLMKRQLSQFFTFMALAVLVGVLFYSPSVVAALAKWLGAAAGGTSAPM